MYSSLNEEKNDTDIHHDMGREIKIHTEKSHTNFDRVPNGLASDSSSIFITEAHTLSTCSCTPCISFKGVRDEVVETMGLLLVNEEGIALLLILLLLPVRERLFKLAADKLISSFFSLFHFSVSSSSPSFLTMMTVKQSK